MREVAELGTTWEVWAHRRAGATDGPGVPPQVFAGLPATVPGSVHTDLVAAGLVDDLAVEGREQDQAWVQELDWSYRTRVGPAGPQRVRELVLEGLDTLATVSVAGEPVLRSSDMFCRYVLDVSDHPDGFELLVEFRAALPESRRREAERGTLPRPYAAPYNQLRKMACSYGWDWGPTTVTCGIWKPVLLQGWDLARAEVDVRADLVAGVPTLSVAVAATAAGGPTDLEGLSAEVVLAGRRTAVVLSAGAGSVRLQDPSLARWEPRGHGDPVLHDVEVTLRGPDGEVLDRDRRRVGFRSVELDTTPDEEGSRFALRVNGRRVWVRGLNWIPDDLFPTRVDRERYRERIGQATAAGADLLRVWGGGTYESDAFYDVCDEQGVLVWQDFLFACAAYDEDAQTVHDVTEEAGQAVRRLRHHASLVLWCGGNECLEGHEHWGWREELGDRPWGELYYRTLLPELVATLDGTRPYVPGSPFSPGAGADPQDSRSGTVHVWTVWGQLDLTHYEDYRPRFVAEFGYQAPASWPTLTRATRSAVLDPASPELQAHQKALGDDKLALGLVRHFPDPVRDPYAWYFATQLLQARAVRTGIGHFRSQYERCSGTVWWQLNDCWPALSWAVVDVAGERRLGWHALREAYGDRLAVLGPLPGDLLLTLVNETDEAWSARPVVRHAGLSGTTLAAGNGEVVVAPRSATRFVVSSLTGRRVDASVQELVVVDVDGAPRATRASRPDRALTLPGHDLTATAAPRPDGTLAVDVTAHAVLRDLCLLAELRGPGHLVDGQLATLQPGESHRFTVGRADGAAVELGAVEELLWSENRVRDVSRQG